VHASAGCCRCVFNENFDFYSKNADGTRTTSRWKRCVGYTNQALGEVVGQIYVDQTFGAEGKERTLHVEHSKSARADIQSVPWMGDDTKSAGAGEAEAISNRIGYTDKWPTIRRFRSYAGMPSQFAARRIKTTCRGVGQIGKPLDKRDAVSAHDDQRYLRPDPEQRYVSGGILQPPFYDNKADDALNFAPLARHWSQLTHGFDDEGSQFDADGNLRDWWSRATRSNSERTSCIKDEYANFVAVDDVKLNGNSRWREHGDNGGLRIAYMALLNTFAGKEPCRSTSHAEQRFFLDGPTPGAGTAPTPSSACWQRRSALTEQVSVNERVEYAGIPEAYHCAATRRWSQKGAGLVAVVGR